MLCVYFITHKIYKYVCVLNHFSHVWLLMSGHSLLCPWNSPGKNIGVVCHVLLQGTFLTQGLNPHHFMFPALAGRFFTTSATWEAYIYVYTFRTQMKKASESLTYQIKKKKKTNNAGEKLFLISTLYLFAKICLMVYARHKSKGWEYSNNSKTRRFHTNWKNDNKIKRKARRLSTEELMLLNCGAEVDS